MNSTDPRTTRQVQRVIIRAPIEKVWEALTRTDAVLPFFFCSVMNTTKLAVGAPIRMRSPDGKWTAVVGEVVEFDPPRCFAHTFRFTNLNDPLCLVRYELKAIEGGTEFTLTSENVPTGTKTEKQMASGGKLIADTLKVYVETGRASFLAKVIRVVNILTAPFAPRQCRSENWPLDKRIE